MNTSPKDSYCLVGIKCVYICDARQFAKLPCRIPIERRNVKWKRYAVSKKGVTVAKNSVIIFAR
jgi:hypothetical protein